MEYAEKIYKRFKDTFNQEPLLVCSPGRVNLIGEHTDYNHGLVLPAAINKHIYLAIQKREDDQIHLISEDYNDSYTTSLPELKLSGKTWPDYIMGVADQLLKTGHSIKGFNAVFGGDIPQGAGLSSSAALECATAFGLNELYNLNKSRIELAKLSQAAENEFVGVKCGLMDQFASLFGKKQHLIRLDCDNGAYEHIPFLADDIKIVLFNTRVKHSLVTSAYNERREQCEKGVELIKKHHPEVKSLRDATEEMLLTYVKPLNEIIYNRCSYVVAEIERLLRGCEDLQNNNFAAFGKKMYETHEGLKSLYEVSCPELDCLVELASTQDAILGARMMGGGFGGCTINIVQSDKVEQVVEHVSAGYLKLMGKELKTYVAEIGEGTRIINLKIEETIKTHSDVI